MSWAVNARAVGPAVKAAMRDNRPTWADERGANFSYETLLEEEEELLLEGLTVVAGEAMVKQSRRIHCCVVLPSFRCLVVEAFGQKDILYSQQRSRESQLPSRGKPCLIPRPSFLTSQRPTHQENKKQQQPITLFLIQHNNTTASDYTNTTMPRKQETSEELPPEQIYCKKQACDIQYCLARRNQQQSACQAYIEAWEQCRDKARQQDAENKKKAIK